MKPFQILLMFMLVWLIFINLLVITSNTIYCSRYYEHSSSNSRIDDDYDYGEYYEYYDDYEPNPRRRSGSTGRSDGYGSDLNPLALLVAPLAGISLLTAAAAVALNPVLVSVSLTGKKRRKRSLFGTGMEAAAALIGATTNSTYDKTLDPDVQEKIHEMEVLEKFLGSVPSQVKYQQQILSMYLSCSGYLEESNLCLDRVVCEYSDPTSNLQSDERDVVAIVLFNIMGNDFVGDDYKDRLRRSAKVGKDQNDHKKCIEAYPCTQLDTTSTATSDRPSKRPKKNF